MKIVVFNGSHRENGNCENFANEVLKECSKNNHVSVFNLSQMNIKNCDGCLQCEEGIECPIDDDYTNVLMPAILDAELLIFATPTYFNMPSASMVNFLDRTNNLCDYFANNCKKTMTYIVGQTDSDSLKDTYNCLHTYYEIMCMNEICDPIFQIARFKEELPQEYINIIRSIVA